MQSPSSDFMMLHPVNLEVANKTLRSHGLAQRSDIADALDDINQRFIRDPVIDPLTTLLRIAAQDTDGSLDPDLRKFVFSTAFADMLLDTLSVQGGFDPEIDSTRILCPNGFVAFLEDHAAACGKTGAFELAGYDERH